MPRDVFVPTKYEVIKEGDLKGYIGFRCLCGRLLIVGKENK